MPKYRVTLQSTVIVDARNPYQAAALAVQQAGDGAEAADVRPAVGRVPGTRKTVASKTPAKKTAKKRKLSPEHRAKLAANAAKARAARARKIKAAKKKATKKR